jgi:hypothetical protein
MSGIFNMEVEMYLLKSPIWPLRRNVVRHNLHADVPLAEGTDGQRKRSSPKTCASNIRPRTCSGIEIGGVEHDHMACHVHGPERS